MTKLFQPSLSIKVKKDLEGVPTGVLLKGKLVRVRRINQQWRIREGWWRNEVAREYFQLETSRFVCLIYRDMLTGNWFLQRVYD